MKVIAQQLVTHRGDEILVFNGRITAMINDGWQPVGPAGVMNMPKFEFYQTMVRYAKKETTKKKGTHT